MPALKQAKAVTKNLKPSTYGQLIRLGSSILLVLILFSATMFNEQTYALLGQFWQKVFSGLGIEQHLPAILQQDSPISHFMHRQHNIIAVLSYSLLYISICIGLLCLLLPDASQQRLAILFYVGAGIVSFFLILGTKIGSIPTLTILNSQLIHFVVSPLPVIILVPLLRWNLSNRTSS
jgi:hypothetical protein